MKKPERKILEKFNYRGKFFGIIVDDVLTSNGITEEWFWIDFPQVCVIAVKPIYTNFESK